VPQNITKSKDCLEVLHQRRWLCIGLFYLRDCTCQVIEDSFNFNIESDHLQSGDVTLFQLWSLAYCNPQSHPHRLIGGRSVDRWDFRSGQSQVDGELPSMMNLIVELGPQRIDRS
jgi:hypothetical protein